MPLVRIDTTEALAPRLPGLGDAVHDSLIEAFGIPVDDRFQILHAHPAARLVHDRSYLGIQRSDDVVFVQVSLRSGRTVPAKQAFYAGVARRAAEMGLRPADIVITLTENELADWSFGDGEAQMVQPAVWTGGGARLLDDSFGPDSRDLTAGAADPGPEGARAALETFYRALNDGDLQLLDTVWSDDELAQLDNPVGGVVRSGDEIVDLYRRIFARSIGLQVTFTDAVAYEAPGSVTFTGREVGSYLHDGERISLSIRTTRCFTYRPADGRWRQVHHHGSIDDPAALGRYQTAVLV